MSSWREQLESDEEARAALEWLTAYYHYPILVFLVGFALWNRARNYSNFIIGGEVFVSGNDPWYHVRSTEYVVQNYPETMPFDPFTNFPHGTFVSQFGTLFDQIVATLALVVGLGSPDIYTTRLVLLLSPALFGVLVAVPLYYMGRRVGGKFGGITAVAFVALAPDRFLQVSLVGSVEHNPIEVVLMSLTILGVMVALTAAEREKPVVELLQAREFEALRGTFGWSLLAGVAFGMYIWAWPPGAWLFGILGVFFIVHMSVEHVRGRSPEHPAFVGAIAVGTAALMQLATFRTVGVSVTGRGILQPGLGIVVAVGIVFLAWLSREFDDREYSALGYPAAVAATLAVAAIFLMLVLPDAFDFVVAQLDRVFGFFTEAEGASTTIGEGQGADMDDIFDYYRFAMYTAVLGAIVLLGRQLLEENPDGGQLLLVIWGVFMVMATLTQVRFGYYLTPVVAVLNAALVGFVFQLMGTSDEYAFPETYQVLTVMVIVFAVFVPMLGLPVVGGGQTAMDVSDRGSAPGSIVGWNESLDWMDENTPEPGQYARPDAEAMDFYGQYRKTDDFDYPPGAYGVLSWWDYGHWITTKGERIANANPFQQHAEEAAQFLIAQDEEEAEAVLSEEFQDGEAQTRYIMIDALMVETESFVATDRGVRGIGGKYFAPIEFVDDVERGDFYKRVFDDQGSLGIHHNQAYYESMVTRLYHYHGSAKDPEPVVVQWRGTVQRTEDGVASVRTFNSDVRDENPYIRFEENMTAAREAVADNPTQQIGGIGALPEERVPALEHYRLVHLDEVPAIQATGGNDDLLQEKVNQGLNAGPNLRALDQTLPIFRQAQNSPFDGDTQQGAARALNQYLYPNTQSYTKTFERVDGATIEGSIDGDDVANVNVTLAAELDPENGKAFTYEQRVETDENGDFTAVVPYSTTGYDEVGVDDGYTNVSVRATGPYELSTETLVDGEVEYEFVGNVSVTESQVVGLDESSAQVTLERNIVSEPDNGTDGSDDGTTDDGTDSTDGTSAPVHDLGATVTSLAADIGARTTTVGGTMAIAVST